MVQGRGAKRRGLREGRRCGAGRSSMLRACLPPVFALESLEQRLLLSVSASTLAGPSLTEGAVFVYSETVSGEAGSATSTITVVGPETAPTGQAAIERSTVETTSSDGSTSTSEEEGYYALTSQGYVEYAEVDTDDGDVENISYSPPQVIALTTLTAGVQVDTSTAKTNVVTESDGTETTITSTIYDSYTLDSQTPQTVTVPAGTFSAYEVTDSEYETSDGSSTTPVPTQEYWSPQAGLIESVEDDGALGGTITAVLTSYSVPGEHLVFTTQPKDAAPNAKIPVVVEVEDGEGDVDTSADGTIDLTLDTEEGGEGAVLGGTTSVDLVDGVATFTSSAGPSVNVEGTYTLTATDSDTSVAEGTSDDFTVANALVWTGAGDGTSWSDAKNWAQDAAPVSGDSLLFPAGATLSPNNDITGLSIASIDITGSGYTLTGNAISLTGGLTSEAGNNTYDMDTTLVGSPTVTDATGDLAIKSDLSGGGLTLSGDGTCTLDQSDTYTGTTTLSAGVTIDEDTADAFGTGAVTIGSGTDPVSIDAPSDGTATIDNDVTLQSGSTLAVDPTVVLSGNLTVGGNSTVEATGPNDVTVLGSDTTQISGSGTITIAGEGTAQLMGVVSADVNFVVNSGTLELDGFLDGASDTTQVTASGGTVQLTDQSHGNGGIDIKNGTLISAASNGSGYYGNITLDSNFTLPTRVVVSPGKNVLGNGQIVVDAVASAGGLNFPTIDASGSQNLVTIPNAVTIKGNGSLSVRGQVAFSQAPTIDGPGDLFTVSSTDGVFLTQGVLGSGTLSLGGPGTIEVDGSVGADVTLNATDGATALHGSPTRLNLNTDLQDDDEVAPPQVVSDCVLTLFPDLSGFGGIDLQGGSMNTGGVGSYHGNITFEYSYYPNDTNAPIAVVTSAVSPFGAGLIIVSQESAANSGGSIPTIDVSALPNGITLQNEITFEGHDPKLTLRGAVELTQAVNVDVGLLGLGGELNEASSTGSGASQLLLDAGISGSGLLAVAGSNITIKGSIGADIELQIFPSSTVYLGAALKAGVSAFGFSQVFVQGDSTLQFVPGFTGTGSIDIQGATVQANITTDYSGDITMQSGSTITLGSASNELGTGQLILQAGTMNIDASAAGQVVSLENPLVVSDGDVFLQTLGSLSFTGAANVNGILLFRDPLDTTVDTTGYETDLVGGIEGTGQIEFNANGSAMVSGDVAAGVTLRASQFPAGSTPGANTDTLTLGANLMGASGATQVTVLNAILHVLPALKGDGGIDMQSGTLKSDGLPQYGGTISLDRDPLIIGTRVPLPGPTVVLTSSASPLGSGTLVLTQPPADVTVAAPTIDATGVPGGVTLSNAINFEPNAVLNVAGSINFTGAITAAGPFNFATTSAGNQLAFSGSIKGTGPLTFDGPGDVTLIANLAAGVGLQTGGTFAGTLQIGTALSGAGGSNQVIVTAGTVSLLGGASGSGGIEVAGGILQGSGAPGYSGTITLDSGTIQDFDATDDKGLGTGNLILNGGTLTNSSGGTALLNNSVSVTGNATVSSQGQRLKLDNSLNLAAGSSLIVTGSMVINGSLSGSGMITLNGNLLGVTGSNPGFTGTVLVTGGTVQVTPQADVLGDGPLKWNLKAQGVLQSVSSIDPVLDNPVTVQSGTLVLDGQFTFPKGVTIDSGASLEVFGSGSTLAVSGPLSGSGNVILFNGGTISTTGGASGFTGKILTQTGKVTPMVSVTDAGGVYNGSPYAATALLSAPGVLPVTTLDGIPATLTYYVGSNASGTGSSTAPSKIGTYTVVASFAGDSQYLAAKSTPVTFAITSASSPARNVTADVSITKGGYAYNHATGKFVQTVTIENTSGSTINGPLDFVLSGLSSGVSVANAMGLTTVLSPLGSPYFLLSSANLLAGQSVTITLEFSDPTLMGIQYSDNVYSGATTV